MFFGKRQSRRTGFSGTSTIVFSNPTDRPYLVGYGLTPNAGKIAVYANRVEYRDNKLGQRVISTPYREVY